MYKLRQYQQDAVNAALRKLEPDHPDPLDTRPATLICSPTGCGKSLILAEIIRQLVTHMHDYYIIKLTHSKELVKQNYEKLISLCPDLSDQIGIHSAGLNRKDTDHPIILGNVQSAVNTLSRNPAAFGVRSLMICDEAHMISPEDDTSYQRVIGSLKKINPDLKILGLTATPFRLKSGHLLDKSSVVGANKSIFTSITFDNTKLDDFNDLIKQGYLAPLIPKQTATEIDLTGVHIQNGDFKPDELQRAVMKGSITERAVKEIIDSSQGRKKWLIFASGIEHGSQITETLTKQGIYANHVHSQQPAAINDKHITEFKAHSLSDPEPIALINTGILTTGFDCPDIDLVGMLRPTVSTGLHVQMLGRATRPHPLKTNALVLDFAGNTARLGPINDPIIKSPRKRNQPGDVPVKICPECQVYNHASARHCINCKYEFPVVSKLSATASVTELIRKSVEIKTMNVSAVTYHPHNKPGKPQSLRVSYQCGLIYIDEWVCPEHDNIYAKVRAIKWLKERLPEDTHPDNLPSTISDILKISDKLKTPVKIDVAVNIKYPEIKSYTF